MAIGRWRYRCLNKGDGRVPAPKRFHIANVSSRCMFTMSPKLCWNICKGNKGSGSKHRAWTRASISTPMEPLFWVFRHPTTLKPLERFGKTNEMLLFGHSHGTWRQAFLVHFPTEKTGLYGSRHDIVVGFCVCDPWKHTNTGPGMIPFENNIGCQSTVKIWQCDFFSRIMVKRRKKLIMILDKRNPWFWMLWIKWWQRSIKPIKTLVRNLELCV